MDLRILKQFQSMLYRPHCDGPNVTVVTAALSGKIGPVQTIVRESLWVKSVMSGPAQLSEFMKVKNKQLKIVDIKLRK